MITISGQWDRYRGHKIKKETIIKLYLVVIYKAKWLFLYLFGYDKQNKIKCKKVYFTLDMYCCQTYIFQKIIFLYFIITLDDLKSGWLRTWTGMSLRKNWFVWVNQGRIDSTWLGKKPSSTPDKIRVKNLLTFLKK